ncbi:MAG: glycosyltransferase, partial [Actinomycetota bacterium]
MNYPFGFSTREHAIGAILAMYTKTITQARNRPTKLVSVVTTAFNTGSLILRAYNSLRGQRYQEWEWVVYDDSTEQETIEILRSLADHDC